MTKEKRQLPYLLVANWDVCGAIKKYGKEKINTLGRNMMHKYLHDTCVPKMLELMSNGTTKAKLLVIYGLIILFQETLGEWIINVSFKYYYSVNNYYVYFHEKKDTIWYK